jgi:hypothetical protein
MITPHPPIPLAQIPRTRICQFHPIRRICRDGVTERVPSIISQNTLNYHSQEDSKRWETEGKLERDVRVKPTIKSLIRSNRRRSAIQLRAV